MMTCPFRVLRVPVLLMCFVISACLNAGAEVRQWGEAAGFDDFGIGTPTIILSSKDTLHASVPIDIGDGDFICAVHAKASLARPWGIALSGLTTDGQPVGVYILLSVTETTNGWEETKLSRNILVNQTCGEESITTTIGCKGNILRQFAPDCSMVVERHDKAWTLTLKYDNSKPESYTLPIGNPGFMVDSFGITVPQGPDRRRSGFGSDSCGVEIQRATVHYTPMPPYSEYASVDVISDRFQRSSDPLEGFYRISERSFDEQYLRPGSDYLLAFIRTDDGGYDIIYITGATQMPGSWHTGMIHGHASPTPAPARYNLKWTDARFRPIDSEAQMTIDGEGTVIFQFPYLFSTVKLQRLKPGATGQ